jgi:hypothetical protein
MMITTTNIVSATCQSILAFDFKEKTSFDLMVELTLTKAKTSAKMQVTSWAHDRPRSVDCCTVNEDVLNLGIA